ncbi:hypothetical protein TanjilG_31237 [Lupinus angustifolius]|uniref:Protein PLASTID REDOX INSENSITIVE 2 n=1 Tax=Lupinus angustifolius TaxID=3871 RepID=A0A1J7INL2_LUPAN|nr:PREDICTED: protein PLASTID REDOX INSENSITIVE 2-like [Lupinus angustifolius]OIW14347.1 hypothetical protein TanjilG_31237 [Lupinus angustifolius]
MKIMSLTMTSSTSCLLSPFPFSLSSSTLIIPSSFSTFTSTICKQQCFSFPSHTTKFSTLSKKVIITKASEYKFPDPIPEFADTEIEKFTEHLSKRLIKKDVCGESVEEVVGICTEIFSTFLHSEYGGPGTLLVDPFVDMADALNERGLPGGSQAARVALKWAQKHVDNDWKEWIGGDSK